MTFINNELSRDTWAGEDGRAPAGGSGNNTVQSGEHGSARW